MITSFADRPAERLFNRQTEKRLPPTISKVAYRKLLLVDAAEKLDDLRIPPVNRLEKLSGDLSGKFSIRINERWRIVFKLKVSDAYEVGIVDYHGG